MKLFEFLKELHDSLVELSSHVRFDKNNRYHFYIVTLYIRMLELTAGIIILLTNKSHAAILCIFRSLIETFVEFSNLARDCNYRFYMEAVYLKSELKILNGANAGLNQYLAEIGKLHNLDELINDYDKKLKELKRNGYNELQIKEKFEMAGLTDFYYSVYIFLSTDSHSNIQALIRRHFMVGDNDFKIVFYKDESIESYTTIIDTICGLLVDASLELHLLLKSSEQESVEGVKKRFVEIREMELGSLKNIQHAPKGVTTLNHIRKGP